ncbi:MAG TPA: S8 family serine peptidase, partial [Thermoanaerobaculia bacterium]|nr:S8 family serine peptidase [Thermoanaerobaculia bacterium]
GIIDTGIDYQHPMFGGSGLLADYKANDRVTIHPGLFPTAKVVGGYDFAGDAYDGSNTPMPDPNPMDCLAHGSHVAGTAAGFGVNSDGTTYTGPYGPSTPFSSLRIGPGVAPNALLYAIRIFGCGGSTGLTPQGIEFAVDPDGDGDFSDHLDVINMSLGAPYGGLSDTSAQAADAAALVGVGVVSAQGNSGDTYFIGGSPGSAERGIAAAASVDSGIPGAVLQVNAPASVAGPYPAAAAGFGGSTPPPGGQTGSLVEVASATGTAAQGCDPNYTNAGAINGSIALIMRGTCSFQKKVANAQAAGAIGAVVFNNVPGDPTLVTMAGDPTQPAITIPSVFISDDNGTLLAGTTGVNATLASASAADTLASFSSRGPVGGGSFPIMLKPDVAAPGVSIPSTQSGIVCTSASQGCITPDPTGFIPGGQVLVLSGTSMATPHTAGTMALLRQLHPDWSVEEIKALLMNGALHDITQGVNAAGLKYGLGRVGAGRIDVPKSAQNSVTAFNDDNPGTVTVGFDSPVVSSVDQVKQLRVVNHGSQAETFDLSFDNRDQAPGVTFSLVDPSQASLSVPADSAAQVAVQMKADATKMDHNSDGTVAPTQAAPAPLSGLGSLPRQTLTEAGSYLDFGQGGTTKLRVPLYSAPMAASAMAGTAPIPTGGTGSGDTSIQLAGIGVCTGTIAKGACNGNFPVSEASLVTPFELQVVHPLDPTIPAFANLQYVGVAYDQPDDLLLFGVSTWGPWSSPADVAFNIYIDSQNSGKFDKIVFNSDPGNMAQGLFGNGGANGQDTFLTAFLDVASSNVSTEQFVNLLPSSVIDTRVFGNNVMVIAVSPKDLGLAGTSFHYRVETCPGFAPICSPLIGFRYDGADGPFKWDYAAQGLDFGGNFLAFDLDGTALPAHFDVGNYLANGSLGALLLHTHNTGGTQAQVLPLQGSRFADVAVAASVSPATVPAKPNTQVTFTIQASNSGPNKARQVVVFDALPSGLSYVSDDGGGAYDPTLGLWTVGQLGVGASATLHITATVVGTGEIVNTARLGSSKPIDPNPENDAATVTLNAPRFADLAVTAKASASSVKAGTGVTFTVTLGNNGANAGADPSYNPRVHVVLGGAKYDLAHISVSQGSFDPASGIWQLGSVGSGVNESLQFRVVPLHGGSVGINVLAISSTPDPNLLNNHASVTVAVH